jgi:hypothetical protein
VRVQTYKKSFGTSADIRAGSVLLSRKILTSTNTFLAYRRHMGVHSRSTRSRISSMSRRSTFSPIRWAVFTLKHRPRISVLSAISGYRAMPSFSKVCTSTFVYSFSSFSYLHITDIHGMLEGERHVERSIDATPKIWYRKEHPLPPLPTPPVNSTSVVTMPVWKQVIRLTVDDRDIDIRISTRPLELEDDWVRSDMLVIRLP